MTDDPLRVLAHPLRSRLVATLRAGGPATATTLARALDTNSGATSYHLRVLADAGLVTEAAGGAGRERRWEAGALPTRPTVGALRSAAGEGVEPGDPGDAEAAFGWLARDWLAHCTERYSRWLDASAHWPPRWRAAATMHDAAVLVTAEQLEAMHAEVAAVIARYARVGQGNPQAKRVAAYAVYYPIDLAAVPRRPAGGAP